MFLIISILCPLAFRTLLYGASCNLTGVKVKKDTTKAVKVKPSLSCEGNDGAG